MKVIYEGMYKELVG
ncbi:Protein of unknown function [Bacillus thuringiensis]|uniref:Uncharacterized protein n=1 Tax=Bacillus thuringiensis TaxID=1428 RepID=A0A1C4E3L8_BACTU|nr:Protein of unknown function [Bacillus thuringiensis]